jgi:hypothetical protein
MKQLLVTLFAVTFIIGGFLWMTDKTAQTAASQQQPLDAACAKIGAGANAPVKIDSVNTSGMVVDRNGIVTLYCERGRFYARAWAKY